MSPDPTRLRAERLSDAVVHVTGLVLACIAVPVLVWLAVAQRGDAATVTAVGIYCITLLAMLGCSALYNMSREGRFTPVFRRLDHSAIFLKIAGSFTPLVAMTGGGGAAFLAGIWAVAIGGSSLKIIAPDRLRWLGLTLYLGLAWVGVYFGRDVLDALTPGALAMVTIAGVIYTAGVVFFLWERLPYHTAIWHAFVLVGTAVLFAGVCIEVATGIAPRVTIS